MSNYELFHHGTKGMRWGIRRYQNKDGSLTLLGKRRARKQEQFENSHEDYKQAHSTKSVSLMSNRELRERNNRLQMERQYSQLTQKTNYGEKVTKAVIATAGTITALEGAYQVYKRVGTPIANKVVDKMGNVVVKSLNKGLSKGL